MSIIVIWTTRQPLQRFPEGKEKNRSAGDLGLREKFFIYSFIFLLIYFLFCFVEETRITKVNGNDLVEREGF